MNIRQLLKLERPLIFLDIETHDKVPLEDSRICEIAFKIVHHEDRPDREWRTFLNPGVPISRGATDVHTITNEDVAGAPRFTDIASSLFKGFTDVDFGGYNLRSFDLPVIRFEFARAGFQWDYSKAWIVDAFRLWQIMEPRTLSDAVRQFCKREPSSAHRALGDAIDSHDVATSLLEKFEQLPRTVQELHNLCFFNPEYIDPDGKFRWRNNEAVIAFGKYSGRLLKNLDEGYLRWIVSGGFSQETKQVAIDALSGIYPEPPAKEQV